MDNQNNQNDYTNFNQYQTQNTDPAAQQPAQPYQQQPYQQQYQQPPFQNPYAAPQQVQYNPYQAPVQTEGKNKSLVLGILSIVLPLISCTYLSPVGFILGLIGVIRNKKSAVSWVGLVLSILLMIYLAFSLYLYFNQDVTRSILESSGGMTESQIDDFMSNYFGFIISKF